MALRDPNIISSPLPTPPSHKPQPLQCEKGIKEPLVTAIEREPPTDAKSPNGSTFDQLFLTMGRGSYKPNNKITVVGAGDVGVATVFSLLAKGVTNDISMIDFGEDKLRGELMDLQYGSKFLRNAKLRASKDYGISVDSKICVLTPCYESESGQKIGDCTRCNAEVMKAVIPQLLHYSPDAIILVAIEPVDVLAYLAWRVSNLPKGRVFGSGTNLYSATFRYLLADRLGLAPSACHGYIIGENGYSSVPVWSGVTVGGVHLKDLNPDIGTDTDPENWQEIHRQVLQSGQEIRDLKGCNSWASALSITDICSTILNDANCIRPLSTYVKGEHQINEEIFMSLPCVVGSAGITDIIRQPLSCNEIELLHKSAEAIVENRGAIKITQ
ncbi:L-lactate dehydrogenase B chain-like [Ostrinia nubilalis]|uniref:L-lactate dehydrogenase B chain-like n=1 Tax=Ostrinia nubilalis TaxID=29057 RepID=UPI00308232F3